MFFIGPRLELFAFLFLVLPQLSFGAVSQWQPLPLITQSSLSAGNSGGEGCQVIQNIAIDSTGTFLMMGTDVGGLYRSLNGGSIWQPADVGYSPRGGCAFAIDPNNNQRVLAVGCNSGAQSWNGLWLSTNQANSWSAVLQKNMQGSGTYHDSVAFDASSKTVSGGVTMSSVAYWVNYSDGGGGLWKSTNGGSTWNEIQTSFTDGIVKVNPSNGIVYVATANGFYRSTNSGASFTQVVSGSVLGLDVIATQPNNVYINETDGVYVSTNSGQSFIKQGSTGLPTTDSPGLRNLKVSPANPSNMLIDDDQGSYTSQNYYYSTNGGSSWQTCSLGSNQSFIPTNTREWLFAWSPTNANQAWSCGGDYISQTTNAGTNFNWAANGYNAFTCTGYFNFNPQNPNLLLVTSQDYNSAFTASVTNTTATWQYLDVSGQGWGGFTYGGYALSPSVMVAGNAPAWGAAATLMVSTNSGGSFSNTGLVGNNTQAACGDPTSSSTAFWDQYRTTNTGSSWSAMNNCDGVFTYNANPSGSHELYGAKGSEVVKSTDHGATWTNVVGVSSTVLDVACDWKNNQLYIVDSSGDLFTSPLSGGTATMITSRLASDNQGNQGAYSVAVDPVDPNVVYTAWTGNSYISGQAVRRSTDGGQTWTPLTLQPGDTGMDGGRESQCVRVNPANRYLYSTGSCFGVWKYPPPSNGTPTLSPTPSFTLTSTKTSTPTATGTLPTATFTPTATATPTATPLYVNCAGPQYVSSSGITWRADQAYATGGWGYTSGTAYSSAGPISGATDPTLYMTERSDTGVTYVFTLPNHTYNVTLKYAETYNTASGQRVFNVALNGSTVISNFDIYAASGGKNIAYDRTFPVTVTNGTLELDETATVQTATLMAVAIVPSSATTPTATFTWTKSSTATSTATGTATRTPTSTASMTPTATSTLTSTASGTPTGTATATPSNTPTGTPTSTATSTATGTSSSTPTATWSATPTASGTPTGTATATPSNTPSGTPTASFTPIASLTSTPSSTSTGTPMSTATSTATGTSSSTPTATWSATPTASPTLTATRTFTATPTATPNPPTATPTSIGTAVYVNCAGPQYVSSSGITWKADQAYATGGWGYTSGTAYSSAGPISGTTDPTLYMTERSNNGVTYIFTLPNQVYNVTLKYAETYNTASGKRVFNVALNGATVISSLDIYAAAGGKNIAYDRTFAVTVTGGKLELDETATVQTATLMGIGIVPAGPVPTPTSTWTWTPTFTPTLTGTPTATPTATSFYVNCAGPQYVSASSGITWLADQAYATGGWGYTSGTAYSSAGPISGTTDPTLYTTERSDNGVTYIFTLPNQAYNVTLKYAETYNTAAGLRVFNVALNGTLVLSGLDLYAVSGGKNIAYNRTFPVTVTGGKLELDETATLQTATLQALTITPYGAPIPAVMRPASGEQQAASPTLVWTLTPSSKSSPTPTPTPTWTPGNNQLAALPYPNPASGTSVHVRLSFGMAGNASLGIFTVGGMKVEEMGLGNIEPGDQTIDLPLSDKAGVPLANGLYYLVFRVSNHQAIGKLLVLR